MFSHLRPGPADKTSGYEHQHRNIQGGAARAAVLGVSDGLVTNVSLILGVAGANTSAANVRLAGLAGLLAGAFSMAAGEYVSMRAQTELLERELEMERVSLKRAPTQEHKELVALYESRGIDPDVAKRMAGELMRTPELALETHAREELGINPSALGSAPRAAAASASSFALGALIPLIPWFITEGAAAVAVSVVLAALGALAIGFVLARFTGRSMVKTMLRQLFVTIAAAAVTFSLGKAVGGHIG